MSEEAGNIVRSAARVLDVLEFLAAAAKGASLTEISTTLGLPKSSTLMLLRTVIARGYVSRDDADRYALDDAFRTHGFGREGGRHARLIALAKPIMDDLCELVGETVLLGIREEAAARLIAKVVTDQAIRWDVPLDRPIPFYCTAIGRVVVAFSPSEQQETMLMASPREKLTASTVTDMDELRMMVRKTSDLGYGVSQDEFAQGGTGIAAPVLTPDGRLVAVLNVGCVSSRFHGREDVVVSALKDAAASLSLRLTSATV